MQMWSAKRPKSGVYTMKRTREDFPVLGEAKPLSEAKFCHEAEKNLKDIQGHLRQLVLQEKVWIFLKLPFFFLFFFSNSDFSFLLLYTANSCASWPLSVWQTYLAISSPSQDLLDGSESSTPLELDTTIVLCKAL